MARWPAIALPREAFSARIQPVHVDDLSGAVASLLGAHFNFKGVLNCVGPQSLTIAALVASLRAQANRSPAWQLPMMHGLPSAFGCRAMTFSRNTASARMMSSMVWPGIGSGVKPTK